MLVLCLLPGRSGPAYLIGILYHGGYDTVPLEWTMATSWIPDALYKQILANVPISCVYFCLVSEGKILLVYRKDYTKIIPVTRILSNIEDVTAFDIP